MANESTEAKITFYLQSTLRDRRLTRVLLLNCDSDEFAGYILIYSERTRYCYVLPLELSCDDILTALQPCDDIKAVNTSLAFPGQDVAKGQQGHWFESFGLDHVDTHLLEAFLETVIGKLPDWYEERYLLIHYCGNRLNNIFSVNGRMSRFGDS